MVRIGFNTYLHKCRYVLKVIHRHSKLWGSRNARGHTTLTSSQRTASRDLATVYFSMEYILNWLCYEVYTFCYTIAPLLSFYGFFYPIFLIVV